MKKTTKDNLSEAIMATYLVCVGCYIGKGIFEPYWVNADGTYDSCYTDAKHWCAEKLNNMKAAIKRGKREAGR